MTEPTPPTQVQHPWRATLRTMVAGALALAALLPVIVDALGAGAVPWVASVVAVAAGVTRVLAIPQVAAWVARFLPWLSPEPKQ